MPEGWAWCRLNEIGNIVTGSTPSKTHSEYYGNEYPFFKPTDLEQGINTIIAEDNLSKIGFLQARQLPKDSILVTCIGATIGKTGLIKTVGTCNQQINAIIPNNSILPIFLFFSCLSDFMQESIISNSSSTTLPILNKSKFASLLLPLPPIEEQSRIIDTLKIIFAQIMTVEQNKSNLKLLIKQAKSKILDLAIHGKLVPQDSSDEPASVLLERLRAEKEAKIKAGELKRDKNDSYIYKNTTDNCYYQKFADGKEVDITDEIPYEVPSSWGWCRFGDYLDVRDGTHDSPKYVDNGFPFVTSKNLIDGKIDFSDVKYISEKDHKNFIQRSFVEDSDILFAMIGSIGNPVLVKKDREFSIKNVALFKPLSKSINYMKYVFFFADHIQTELTKKAKGGMQPFVPLSFFRKDLWIPIPPLAEQKRIVEKIENFYSILDKIAENLA